jgi:hypothetical protein
MPYIPPDHYVTPHDDTVIWRYMNLAKFVAILQRRELFLCRLDCLQDPHEGLPPVSYFQLTPRQLEVLEHVPKAVRDRLRRQLEDAPATMRETTYQLRGHAHVSCWHMSQHESAAMWTAYRNADCSIAIRTNIARLKVGLTAALQDVWIAKVDYLDFDTAQASFGNFLPVFVWKRRSFEHEKEVRLVYFEMDSDYAGGLPVSVDPSQLIESVLVAPTAEPWMREVVEGLAATYGLNCPVLQSDLNADPVY